MKLTDEMLEEILKEEIQITAAIRERSLPDVDSMEPHQFSPRFHRRMRRIMRRQKKRSHSMRILKRAAVVVLCIGLSVFGLSMTAEASRVEFFKVVTQIYSYATETTYTSKQITPNSFSPTKITELPEGMKEITRTESETSINIVYQSEDCKYYIDYSHEYLEGTFGYDSEDAEIETVHIKGEDATFVSEYVAGQMRHMLVWTDWNSHYIVISNLSKDEIIKAAESVKTIDS